MGFRWPQTPAVEELTKPLTEETKNKDIKSIASALEKEVYTAIKGALVSASGLGLLDFTKPFNLYAHECKGIIRGVVKA